MIQLYYYPGNASFAPHLLLEELGAEFELVLVDRKTDAQKSAEYRKLNPFGRIPTLVDGELVIFESAAICIYICEQYPKSGFMPAAGHPARPLFFQWLMYLTNTLQSEFMVYYYPERHTTDKSMAVSVKAAQDARLSGMFELLDREIGDRPFLVGDTMTVCDHFMLMMSLWSEKLTRPPLEFPNLRRYLRQMARRDAVVRVCEKEQESLDAYK